jgi:hypothetical protein
MSTVAGHGHTCAPGSVNEILTNLELDTKRKLSTASTKILSDAVDRDLKQAKLEYDTAYKDAVVVWEIDKQNLISAWDRELVGIKQTRAHKEALVEQTAAEVSARGAILINAKTVIELQMEELRKQLANLEGATIDAEIQLIQQKVLTAQRKLAIIPILQQIVIIEGNILAKERLILDKESLVIAKEGEKTVKYTELISKETEVSDKKVSNLIPATLREIEVTDRLNVAIVHTIDIEKQIATEQVTQAQDALVKANKQVLITKEEIKVEEKQLDLMDIKINKTEKQIELEGYDAKAMDRQVDLSEVAVEKSEKQINLLNTETNVETKKLDILAIDVEKAEQQVLIQKANVREETFNIARAKVKIQEADVKVQINSAEVNVELEQVKQITAKTALQTQKYNADLALQNADISNITVLDDTEAQVHSTIMAAEKTTQSTWGIAKTEIAAKKVDSEVTSVTAIGQANSGVTIYSAQVHASGTLAEADINAMREITAELTHLIG